MTGRTEDKNAVKIRWLVIIVIMLAKGCMSSPERVGKQCYVTIRFPTYIQNYLENSYIQILKLRPNCQLTSSDPS